MEETKTTKNFTRFTDYYQDFFAKKGFSIAVKLWRDMVEGRQWFNENLDSSIKKQTLNFLSKIVDNKCANLTANNINLIYSSTNPRFNSTEFNNYIKYVKNEMDYSMFRRKIVSNSVEDGIGILHVYIDNNKKKLFGLSGKICCENIDVYNFAVANPRLHDIQRQKWIMIRTREDVRTLRSNIKDKKIRERIIPNDADKEILSDDQIGENKYCYVYTRYFRIDGQVYYERSTENVDLGDPIPLNPFMNKILDELVIDENADSNDVDKTEKYDIDSEHTPSVLDDKKIIKIGRKQKFDLYPIEILCLKERRNSFIGLSQIESLVPSQVFVNFMFTMLGVSMQSTAFGKWIAKQNALPAGFSITDDPRQLIIDKSMGSGFGIKKVEGTNVIGNGVMETVLKTIDIIRDLTNSKDLITSETLNNKDMSGYLYALISEDANKPINDMLDELKSFEIRVGRILELFVKFYAENTSYIYELDDYEFYKNNKSTTSENEKIQKTMVKNFNGIDYLDTEFAIKIDAGVGYQVSEANTMQMVQTLFMNGVYDKMSTSSKRFFIELCPPELLPVKDKLKILIEQEEESEINQLRQQLADMQQQFSEFVNEADRNMQALLNRNKYLSSISKIQQQQFKEGINAKDNQINARDKAAEELLKSNTLTATKDSSQDKFMNNLK